MNYQHKYGNPNIVHTDPVSKCKCQIPPRRSQVKPNKTG